MTGFEWDCIGRGTYQSPLSDRILQLRNLQMRPRDRNRRFNLHALPRNHVPEDPRPQMAPGIHRHNLSGVEPCGKGADVDGGLGVGVVGFMFCV